MSVSAAQVPKAAIAQNRRASEDNLNSVRLKASCSPARTNYSLENQAQVTLAAVNEVMQRTGISIHGLQRDTEGLVEARVRDLVKTWEIGDVLVQGFDVCLATGVDMAASAYGHTPIDTQVHIALFTLLATCVDELLIDTVAIEEFSTRYTTGSPQRHPLLQHFADNISSMNQYFLPYAANTIVTEAMVFVDYVRFSQMFKSMSVHEAALQYVEWNRTKTGLGKAHALFIWDKYTFPNMLPYGQVIPEVMLCANYMNDIFSFYKRELNGERDNYIYQRATTTKKTAHEALFDVVNDTVAGIERARRVLAEYDAENMALENFLAGYTAFHIHSPRNRLSDLMKTEKA